MEINYIETLEEFEEVFYLDYYCRVIRVDKFNEVQAVFEKTYGNDVHYLYKFSNYTEALDFIAKNPAVKYLKQRLTGNNQALHLGCSIPLVDCLEYHRYDLEAAMYLANEFSRLGGDTGFDDLSKYL